MSKASLADQVIEYLLHNPDAQGTLEGIQEWWLADRGSGANNQDVEGVVRDLVARGHLVARKARDGQVHYRLNRRPPVPRGGLEANEG